MTAEMALRGLLGALALYHVAMGLVSAMAPSAAGRLAGALYGVRADDAPQLRYGVRMLGLYALALGALLALAAWDPGRYAAVVVVAGLLQLARAAARLLFRRELAAGFRVTASRNAGAAALLVAEGTALLGLLPLL